ncbi:flavoprotein [Clavulina sp. PMI_390]|nr:flavoprotein [Clavulina sp. PMI_390]
MSSSTSPSTATTPPRVFQAESNRVAGNLHVLLVTTGSVASIKAPLIVPELLKYQNVKVQVVSSARSLHFFDPKQLETENPGVTVWTDEDEWGGWKIRGDPILHIELRRWADLVLIAPCSANTIAKIANGLSDNLVTSLLRALAPTTPTIIFPAMNTLMYEHPLTARHLETIEKIIGYEVNGPIGKELACGDVGTGAMTDWRDIVKLVAERFLLTKKSEAET